MWCVSPSIYTPMAGSSRTTSRGRCSECSLEELFNAEGHAAFRGEQILNPLVIKLHVARFNCGKPAAFDRLRNGSGD